MGTSGVTTFESALVNSLPGCGSQHRCHSSLALGPSNSLCIVQKKSNSSVPLRLKLRRISTFVPPSSLRGEDSGTGDIDIDSDVRNQDEIPSTSASDIINASGQSLLPSRKIKNEAEAKPKGTAAQSALEKAIAYRKMKELSASQKPGTLRSQLAPSPPLIPPSNLQKVEILIGKPIQSPLSPNLESPSLNIGSPTSRPSDEATGSRSEQPQQPQESGNQSGKTSAVEDSDSSLQLQDRQDNTNAAARSAFEKAKAYKVQQADMIAALNEQGESELAAVKSKTKDKEEKVVEVEIHTRDGVIRRSVQKPGAAFANVRDLKRTCVSDLDFVGLGFADKKSSTSKSAGMNSAFEAPTGPLPEVEILTRDAGIDPGNILGEPISDVYKPRVTTWGVFPRPVDISKTYGGGRNIKPGQKLETEEEKVARETRTKKLLDDYRKKMGLDMDPKAKARCERTIQQGENLMDRGRLRDALAAFETVMDEMPFTSELHGLAALQEAVCLDSLNRSGEAKLKYEKLVSHPNGAIRKKARQFLFGFQAAEKLKVRADYNWDGSTYRKYFDAFADGYNTTYKASGEDANDESLMKTLPYALFLMFPVILVFTLVALKSI